MKKFVVVFYFIVPFAYAQSMKQCKHRFDTYLNFRTSLNKVVIFEKDVIYFLDVDGNKELAIYAEELKLMASFFEHANLKKQEALIKSKGLKKYSKRQRDSIFIFIDDRKSVSRDLHQLPLQGYRVAIDPGHFGTNLADAQIEQKYLYFVKDSVANPNDSVKLFESTLTFHTAKILQIMLEAKGAKVMLTRDQANFTSFNCTYQDWIKKHKSKSLDSLLRSDLISKEKYSKLQTCSDHTLFWEFFRDYDLANRSAKINQFNPHASAIIHFNVDEKNEPWKKFTGKNFTMAFIGGAFTAENLSNPETRLNFLRLLFTQQLNQSEKIAKQTVSNFHKKLNIPLAKQSDAEYLQNSCLSTHSSGVFCRNLALCRRIASPLVYGESLYQDNEKEAVQLMKSDLDLYGLKTNARLMSVAGSYYEALFDFLKNY